ncbi:MAG: hypothetical protein AAGE65_01680 [Planctomycetota bacterium]
MYPTARPIVAVALCWLCAVSGVAQVTNLRATQIDNSSVPELRGFDTYDVTIDFVGEYSSSQILLTLDQGTLFQVGGDTPPSEVFLDLAPETEFDTFFAQGGATAETTVGSLIVGAGGGPVNIDETLVGIVITDTRLQADFGPSGSDEITDQTDFLVARISLSNGIGNTAAFGNLAYLGVANGDSSLFQFSILPEPASGLLLVASLIAGTARRKHRP